MNLALFWVRLTALFSAETVAMLRLHSRLTNPRFNIRINFSGTHDNPHSGVAPGKSKCSGDSVAISVFVDIGIRRYLSMKNNERKTRVLLPSHIPPANLTNEYLRNIIEKRLPSLCNRPYVLRMRFSVDEIFPRRFDSDAELQSRFISIRDNLPFFHVYVDPQPGIFPPPTKEYLRNTDDPAESQYYTLLSFYRFTNISNPDDVAIELRELWKPFKTVGRIYLATEGVNAQMAVPTNILSSFKSACETHPLLMGINLNTDHVITRNEFIQDPPFKALHIRVREQIVTDGWSEPLDLNKSGREMPPLEWHKEIDNPNAIVLDCRNSYESDIGKFDNAIPLNTTFFRESWPILDEILTGISRNSPILTYCTGGIRCVKINAYLEQKLGFTNVSRLQGGIVSYTRELEQIRARNTSSNTVSIPNSTHSNIIETSFGQEDSNIVTETTIISTNNRRHIVESKFRGANYVFDGRMGSPVTAEVLTQCETCGAESDSFTNCNSYQCHVRFIQCEFCRNSYNRCCSRYCQSTLKSADTVDATKLHSPKRNKIINRSLLSRSVKLAPETTDVKLEASTRSENDEYLMWLAESNRIAAVEEYCSRQSVKESELLQDLRSETERAYQSEEGALRMLCSAIQGRMITALTRMNRAKAVLELGTFTGYSALCFAEGLDNTTNPTVPLSIVTCDIDSSALHIAKRFIEKSKYSDIIEIRNNQAMDVIQSLIEEGRIFDLIFIDADKKAYKTYVERILEGNLLRSGGLIMVDNTLWKGLVLREIKDLAEHSWNPSLFGKADRMKKLAINMHEFNVFLKEHPHFQPLMLPLRDGLTIVTYNP